MLLFILIFLNIVTIGELQFDFPDFDFPDFEFPDFEFPELPDLPDFSDFESPCKCEGSHCECCLNAFLIEQEGCIRVAIRNNSRIRVSFVLNGQELGGFSTRLGTIPVPNGISFTVPCLPNANLSLRVKNSRLRRNGRGRFCLNLLARKLRITLYNQDFCFDVNGNALTRVVNG